jgi:hypothetical protein
MKFYWVGNYRILLCVKLMNPSFSEMDLMAVCYKLTNMFRPQGFRCRRLRFCSLEFSRFGMFNLSSVIACTSVVKVSILNCVLLFDNLQIFYLPCCCFTLYRNTNLFSHCCHDLSPYNRVRRRKRIGYERSVD